MEKLDINQIKDIIPHRYPFLLVDRIEELVPEERVVGKKNVTINEEFFQGHFPGHPIMPGVLILEAMAQVGGFLLYSSVEDTENMVPYFTGVDKAKFRRPVTPGDTLIIEGQLLRLRGMMARVEAKSYVDEQLAAEGRLTFVLQDK